MAQTREINERIVRCTRCPRLVAWREDVAREKRKAFQDWEYWGKPVPNFGPVDADRLIVGLAPAAHGANRTGRMFTGDRSGDWLYRALHRAGLASKPTSDHAQDGLVLRRAMVTAVCHCAPPDNKPTADEIESCSAFLSETLASRSWLAVLCLGGLAWSRVGVHLGVRLPKFAHGAELTHHGTLLIASYHPSQQNTFTGRLTEAMLDDVVARFSAAG